VLAALAAASEPLDVPTLLARAWGPDVPLDRGASRVHVALSHLRKLGLTDHLVTVRTDDGPCYSLSCSAGSGS